MDDVRAPEVHSGEGATTEALRTEDPGPEFLRLMPVTSEFISDNLRRRDYRFTVMENGKHHLPFEDFVLTIGLHTDGVLALRFLLRRHFLAQQSLTMLSACNDWNSMKTFLKASITWSAGLTAATEEQPSAPMPICLVQADHDEPVAAGMAPVQFQNLIVSAVSNTVRFKAHCEQAVGQQGA